MRSYSAGTASVTVGADRRVALTGTIRVPKGFQVRSATIMPDDGLLYEPAARTGDRAGS
jgi:hypothetical protein